MKMSTRGQSIALALLLLPSAAIAESANDILGKVEKAMNAANDQVATTKMILKGADGKTKSRELKMQQKGDKLRLIRFLSPADVKGVGFLVRSDEEMYLYLPEFGKVRRIASHVKNESFMGTDFSYDDLSSSGYVDEYNASIARKNGNTVVLELLPKNADDTEYSKLLMTVDTSHYLPVQVEFFDKKGKKWKVMKQEEVVKVSGFWVAKRISMEDLSSKHSTVMEMSDIEFNRGLSDGDFSRRNLKRAR
jgi:outer membrane lipoprotein-sorting protein